MLEQTVTIQRKITHYWEEGAIDAPTVVFLHGGFGDASLNWLGVMAQLAADYRLIAPDLPGYGGTDRLSRMTLDGFVDWLLHLLDALKIEQAAIVGNSFGGYIGRVFAVRYPLRTPALVLVNGGVIPAIPVPAKIIARLPGIGGLFYRLLGRSQARWQGLSGAIRDESIVTPARYGNIKANARGLSGLMQALSASAIPTDLTPQVPVLLLWGEEDILSPRVSGERVQAQIPGSKMELIADIGHMPHIEAEDTFVFQLNRFLAGLSTTPS